MSTSHALALALDEYLALTAGPCVVPCHAIMRTPAEALAVVDEEFAFYNLADGNVPPAVRALSRLRFEAACEIERLLRLLDALDGDEDIEPMSDGDASHEDEAQFNLGGFESNFASTAAEDATGIYAEQHTGRYYAAMEEEAELVCEDEGAQCDDEGAPDDHGIADVSGAIEQGHASTFHLRAVV